MTEKGFSIEYMGGNLLPFSTAWQAPIADFGALGATHFSHTGLAFRGTQDDPGGWHVERSPTGS